jgi:hypothetical protein
MAKGAGRNQVCYVTMARSVPTSATASFKKVDLPDEDGAAPED